MYQKFFSMGILGPQVVHDDWHFDFQEPAFRSVPAVPDNGRDVDGWRGPYIDYMLATLFNPELPVPCAPGRQSHLRRPGMEDGLNVVPSGVLRVLLGRSDSR